MRFRIDFLGVTLLDITTGHDAHLVDQDGPTGADSSHERRDSPTTSWTHLEPAEPDTDTHRLGFHGRTP